MNSYGQEAWNSWRALAPTALSEIPDPRRHFSEVGEQASAMVAELMVQLAGPDLADETYLEKVGRLNAAKLQAEELVRAEVLTPPPEIDEDLDEGDLMGPFELVMQETQALLDEYRKHTP